MLKMIENNADKTLAMIEELLLILKLDQGIVPMKLEEVGVTPLLAERLLAKKPEGKELRLDCSAVADLKILADKVWLCELVDALFQSLAENLAPGACLDVKVSTMPGRRKSDKGDLLRIDIHHPGLHLPEEIVNDLFENERGVEGLSENSFAQLSFCHEICQLHGGNLVARRHEPEGTLWSVYLPDVIRI